jgi:serine/threonine protein kinase
MSDIDAVVRAFLMTDEAGTKTYQPAGGEGADLDGVEVLPGLLCHYRQTDPQSRSVTLQVFVGVGEIGAQLWDQEVRVLLRVASLQHPALPEVLDGGHVEAEKISARLGGGRQDSIAYVRTLADYPVDAEDIDKVAETMHSDLVQALRQLWLLADGLAILHDARIAHRNLWPGTLQAYLEGDRWALRISRFEMSAMLSNILRASSVDASGRDIVRGLYLAQGNRMLRYAPPERLSFLLQATPEGLVRGPSEGPGSDKGDVFGLGMIAAEWFLGGLADAPNPDHRPTLAELLEFQRRVRVQVRTSPAVPSALGSLLDDMLDRHPAGRPTTAEVVERLSRNYDGIVSLLQGTGGGLPHLLLYLPETRSNLGAWDMLDDPTETDPRKIARVIEEDLRGALVVESPEGAEPYLANRKVDSPEKLRQAKWVLIGPKAAWFCRPYELHAKGFGAGELLSDVYVIGYVALRDRPGSRDRLKKLEEVPLQRRVGSVQVESDRIALEVLERLRKGRPDWTELFDTVKQPVALSSKEQSFAQALDFLLEFQGAQLQARTYAFRRDPTSPSTAAEVVLHWDRKRDRERRDRLPALHAKLHGDTLARPAFAHFFEEVSQSEESTLSYLRMFHDGIRGQNGWVGDFSLVRTIGEDTVVVHSISGAAVPDQGVLSPRDDLGTRIVLRRQLDARQELVRNRILVNRLISPMGIRGAPDRWRDVAGQLEGEGARVVIDMLCHQPIFALQGPPGTGKTEISSQAVQAYLRADPRARILVSAQSHFTLDNLAARILGKLGVLDDYGRLQDTDLLSIRVFNERAYDRVDERLLPFQVGESAVRLRGTIRRRVRDRIDIRVDSPKVRRIAESWLSQIEGSEAELGERLRRGANLVFITCSAATRETLVDNGSREPFDWVIIEEAAKAWPTELALPLVRGLRWTLVGDHKQIGAYGRPEVERFLNSCMDDPDPEIAKHYGRKDDYLKTFEVFGTMISQAAPVGPVRTLTEQRRMRDPISQVVSRSFYPVAKGPVDDGELPKELAPTPKDLPDGLLVTRREDNGHAIESPAWLSGCALVWLDTSGMRQEEGYWSNPYEADLVASFVRSLRPTPLLTARPDKASRLGLAILTPYRRQVEAIQRAAPILTDAVKTVDAFQGREADLVVVSLVRDNVRASWDQPLRNIGHLADPSRVNVMLIRARDLLVLIGSFDHFAGSGVPTWESVTTAVERFGIRRPAASVMHR